METVLANLASTAQVEFDTKWNDLATAGITRDTPVDVRLRGVKVSKALQVVLGIDPAVEQLKQAAIEVLDNGKILITTRQALYTKYTLQRQYEISDLLGSVPGEQVNSRIAADLMHAIGQLVQDTVDSASWAQDLCGHDQV
jgi:hypothetical protein